MYKHKHISYTRTNGDLAGVYYSLYIDQTFLGQATIRGALEFMFRFYSEASSAYVDRYVLNNIAEILELLNRKHGLLVHDEADAENNYEF